MHYIIAFVLWTGKDFLPSIILLAFGTIRHLRHIAYELQQVGMPQHLPYGVGLTRMVETMVLVVVIWERPSS